MLEPQTHPFNPYIPDYAKGVIIGSAPPDQFCNKKPGKLREGEINFFYGSLENRFWYLMKYALEPDKINWPRNVSQCRRLLRDHSLGIGDILLGFDREDGSPADTDLCNFKYNEALINSIMSNGKTRLTIKYLFFTSAFTYDLFGKAIIQFGYTMGSQENDTIGFTASITNTQISRKFNLRILMPPSPAARISISTQAKDYREKFCGF